jgi:hypothetical protein
MKLIPYSQSKRLSPNTWVSIEEGLLPILFWPDVCVIREVEHQMTFLERLILETSEEFGEFTVDDIELITGAHVRALGTICTRLTHFDLLHELRSGVYVPRSENAREALAKEAFLEQRQEERDFIFLPRTGDLIEVLEGDAWLKLTKLIPRLQSPVPTEFHGRSFAQVVDEWVRTRPCPGVSASVKRAVTDDDGSKIAKICPAYSCRGAGIETKSGKTLNVTLFSNSRRRGRQRETVNADLSYASGLVETLSQATVVCRQNKRTAMASMLDLSLEDIAEESIESSGPVLWTVSIGEEQASSLARKGTLLAQPGVTMAVSDEWLLNIECRFRPANSSAAREFILERLAASLAGMALVTEDIIKEHLHRSCGDFGMKPEMLEVEISEILEWLWDRGEYAAVYAARQQGDFHYD